MEFKKLSTISSWAVFAIATFTYILTIEPTVSWWDCGEFIASAYKLQVGHPPGAPFFMLLGRFFTLFAFGQQEYAAIAVNIMSALSSSFTIYFLFLIAIHLLKKFVPADENSYTNWQKIGIIGSASLAALTYTFTDSFWFSAVEGEVYALSSFFTAIVIWAMFKWENIADQPHADKWLVLIAYLMGLSIGVHLLNLLTIPALAVIFYSKRYVTTPRGYVYAVGIGAGILLFVQYGIVQGLLRLAIPFEIYFVNNLEMPLWTGALVYFALILGILILGLYFSYKYRKAVINLALNFLLVILIGYSSYSLIVIRSLANPPMDENNPENLVNLLAYLNREQYGNRPLFYGQYYNAPVVETRTDSTYYFEDGIFKTIEDPNTHYVYDPAFTTIFPRMYSSQGGHVRGYRSWAYINSPPNESPNFLHNALYAIRYQISFMYVRYLMWNFAGRQNDTQGYGNFDNGNWISGIPFIDALRLGNQSEVPTFKKQHASRNSYYMLPFILGIIGLVYIWKRNKNYFLITTLLFIFTGLAIVFYVNQPPFQPRERDYSYVGSFYVFALWIGFGALAIMQFLEKKIKPKTTHAFGVMFLLFLAVPLLMAFQNWDDHNRSGRYSVREIAKNFLKTCEKNAIIFTYGDNDTFPLWYVQEVENYRTDVRVVNLSLLSADWYIAQMMRKSYESEPLKFQLQAADYALGKREFLPIYKNPDALIASKFENAPDSIKNSYQTLYQEFISLLDDSDFEAKLPNDYKSISSGAQNLNYGEFHLLIRLLSEKENTMAYGLNEAKMKELKQKVESFSNLISNDFVQLKQVIQFAGSQNKSNMVATQSGQELNYIPDSKFKLSHVSENGNEIKWELNSQYVTKSDLAALDIIASNYHERPIYFAASMDTESMLGLDEYLRLDGLAYKLTSTPKSKHITENIDTEVLFRNMITEFKWGNIEKPDFYLCEHNTRTLNILSIRDLYYTLASKLYEQGNKERAVMVADTCFYYFPGNKYAFSENTSDFIKLYKACKQNTKADKLTEEYYDYLHQHINWYNSQADLYAAIIDFTKTSEVLYLYEATENGDKKLAPDLARKTVELMQKHLPVVAKLEAINMQDSNFNTNLAKLTYEENIQAATYLGLLRYSK